mmetsp:Transcript_2918/g.8028  ORF Transcript_2918/g.8028 Transcript_2918/m.8028 type:complete len:283 (-) Transcript_2918:175-1023(-)
MTMAVETMATLTRARKNQRKQKNQPGKSSMQPTVPKRKPSWRKKTKNVAKKEFKSRKCSTLSSRRVRTSMVEWQTLVDSKLMALREVSLIVNLGVAAQPILQGLNATFRDIRIVAKAQQGQGLSGLLVHEVRTQLQQATVRQSVAIQMQFGQDMQVVLVVRQRPGRENGVSQLIVVGTQSAQGWLDLRHDGDEAFRADEVAIQVEPSQGGVAGKSLRERNCTFAADAAFGKHEHLQAGVLMQCLRDRHGTGIAQRGLADVKALDLGQSAIENGLGKGDQAAR